MCSGMVGSDVLAFFMFFLLSCGDFRGQRFLGFVKADCLPRVLSAPRAEQRYGSILWSV